VKEENLVPSVCPEDACSCTNSNGQCAYVPDAIWGKSIYSCEFDENTACNGKIILNTNGQQVAGLLQNSDTFKLYLVMILLILLQ